MNEQTEQAELREKIKQFIAGITNIRLLRTMYSVLLVLDMMLGTEKQTRKVKSPSNNTRKR